MSHFEVFNAFFTEMLGDLDGYNDLDEISYTLQYIYFTITSIILTVAMLNMLISIISETFGKVKETEKMTRTYELINIVTEIDYLVKDLPEKEPEYLIYIYNDKHEESETSQMDILSSVVENHGKIIKNLEEYVENLKGNVIKHFKEQKCHNQEDFKRLENIFRKNN